MNRLKRIAALLAALALGLTLAACQRGDDRTEDPGDWQEQYDLGMKLLSEGNYDEAILAFEAAIEIDAKQADAYLGLARAYAEQGDTAKAQRVLRDGLRKVEDRDGLDALEDMQAELEVSSVPAGPDMPEAPGTPDMPDTTDTPDAPDTTEPSSGPDTPDTPSDTGTEDGTPAGWELGLDQRGFFRDVTAKDIVTLPDYRNAHIPAEVSDEEVEQLILDALINNNTEPTGKVTEGVVADGDTLNIDYVGRVDGVPFEGGSTQGQGTTVTIGVTQYIDDFLEQLIGRSVGENFDIEVTFPDYYPNNPDLQSKDAVFNVTINYIGVYEITDESVAALGFGTAREAREAARAQALSSAQSQAVSDLLSQAACEEVPQSVLDAVFNINMLSLQMSASSYGVDLETMSHMYGYPSLEALQEQIRSSAASAAVTMLASQAIAEIEGLEVTDQDIIDAGAEAAAEQWGEPFVRFSLLQYDVVPAFLTVRR